MFNSNRTDVVDYLNSLFSDVFVNPTEQGALDHQILSILLGTKKTRLGPKPCDDHCAHLTSLIHSFTENNNPIHLITMWGGLKAYGYEKEADLIDLLALRRFKILGSQVAKVYAPGLKITVIKEDLTEIILSQSSVLDLSDKMVSYRDHLESLIDGLGIENVVRINEESQLIPVAVHVYLRQIVINRDALIRHYYSRTLEPDLAVLGWRNAISSEAWEFYLKRAESEFPGSDLEFRVRAVCSYLACSLARAQYKVIQFDQQPIKLSLCPYPPGTSEAMYRGRVEYKLKDSSNSNKTIPPWTGFGIYEKGDCKTIGLKDYREGQWSKILVAVNGVGLNVLEAV